MMLYSYGIRTDDNCYSIRIMMLYFGTPIRTTQYLKFTPFSFIISLILIIASITYSSLIVSHTVGPATEIFVTAELPVSPTRICFSIEPQYF